MVRWSSHRFELIVKLQHVHIHAEFVNEYSILYVRIGSGWQLWCEWWSVCVWVGVGMCVCVWLCVVCVKPVCQRRMWDFMQTCSVGLQICFPCHSSLTATKSTFYLSESLRLTPPQPASLSLCLLGVVSLRLGVLPPVGKSKRAARKRGKRSDGGGDGGVEGIEGGSQIVPDQC